MDYETKIYLEKLIGAVDSPDWWSIGITAVNALIVVGLTIWQLCLNRKQTKIQERQNELQEQQLKIQEQQNQLQKVQTELMEQQTKAQEYAIYKPLYSIVKDADNIAERMLNFIYNYFSVPYIRSLDKDALRNHMEHVQTLEGKFYESSMDFDLKFSPKEFSIYYYTRLLQEMHRILKIFVSLEANNKIILIEDDNESNAVLLSHRANDETIIIDAIVKRIGDKKLQQGVKNSLIGYLAHRKSVMALGIADKIKDRITPNNKE
ncbi:MAG: hypothetical protein J6J77_09510 [Alistipes sp.]|nr:hypothetical protein [Alistipes sp.]